MFFKHQAITAVFAQKKKYSQQALDFILKTLKNNPSSMKNFIINSYKNINGYKN